MKKIIFTFICILTPLFVFSQKEYSDSISSALRILKIHESSLQELSPFDEEGMENIDRLKGKVEDQLLELLLMKSAIDLPKDTIPFFSSESVDKKLSIFHWEEKLGGSFRSFANIFHWKNKNGEPKALSMADEFAYYGSIFQLKNSSGETLYLLIGGGVSCNTCRYERALLLKTKDSTIEQFFSHQIDYRFHNDIDGLSFDEKNKTLNYQYLEEDCEDDNCWVTGKFKFVNDTFEKIDD